MSNLEQTKSKSDARHLLARSEALDAVDARHLRQSRDRRPCLHDLASSTAVRLLGFVAQTKKPGFCHRCALDPGVDATAAAQPELLRGNSPLTLDARVPAIQRPSARSHRTVDNSLITSRIEYSTFLSFLQLNKQHLQLLIEA